MFSSKYPVFKINVNFLKSSSELLSNNNLYIPISINKTQQGAEYVYIGKNLIIQLQNGNIINGTYQQKLLDNTEYLLINDISILSTTTFNVNDSGIYNEIDLINSENDFTTITDIKSKLLATKNENGYKGKSGIVTANQLEAIESISYDNLINQKFINEFNTNSIIFYYEKNIGDKFDVNFQLTHSLFTTEYTYKNLGINFLLKQNKFTSALELSNLNIEVSVNKINNNSNTKSLYQFVIKLINIPQSIITNVEKVKINIGTSAKEFINYFINLPTNYSLTNLQQILTPKLFNRNILFHDPNGLVSVKDYEEIQLNGLSNVNETWNTGYYFYDNFNVNDLIFNNLPLKNVFYLQVKRLSSDIKQQLLFILDTTKNEVRQYSRFRNNNTFAITPWIEYVTSSHKHNAVDIVTDATHQFVTLQQITQWNNNTTSLYWKDAVATKTDLPTTTNNGDTRLVLNENKIYRFSTINNQWIVLNTSKLIQEILSDKIRIKVNEGATDQTIELPFVSVNNPGIVPADFYATDYQSYFESQLDFTIYNAGSNIPSNYQRPLLKTFNVIKPNNFEKVYDGIINYVNGDGINVNIINLSVSFDIIQMTIYTEMDNNNMFTGVISKHNFILSPNGFQTKVLLPSGYTTNLITNQNSTVINNEIILDVNNQYVFEIITGTKIINIIKLL